MNKAVRVMAYFKQAEAKGLAEEGDQMANSYSFNLYCKGKEEDIAAFKERVEAALRVLRS